VRRVDVLYFVEHVARELDVACLVKSLAGTRHGLELEVLSLPYDADHAVRRFSPQVVAVPYLYSTRSRRIPPLLCRWPGAAYFSLNWEQLLNGANQRFQTPREAFVRESVFHQAWTRPYRSFLLSHGVRADNIFPNGNPALALYRPPYRAALPGREELARRHGLRPDARWLFFPENYGWAFLSDREIEAKVRQGYDREMAHANRLFNRESLAEVLRWLARLARERDAEIVLRPRPAIAADEYRQRMAEVLGPGGHPPALHVIKAGTVREWNLASDVVVSSFSTTLLEAAVAGRPAYFLEPLPFPEFLRTEWIELGVRLGRYEELAEAFDRPDPDAARPLRAYMEGLQCAPGDAVAHLAGFLAQLVTAARSARAPLRPAARLPWTERLGGALRRWRPSAAARPGPTRFADDAFGAEEVRRRVAAWEQALRESARVS
jgi:surface carbohydrate biosynthesis protein